jgi:ABC-type uncharacterized transport system permease subunit
VAANNAKLGASLLERLWRDPRMHEAILRTGESVVALLIGLAIGAVILWAAGYSAWDAYYYLFSSSLLDSYGLASTLSFATPILLTGLTFAVGVRAGLFNIGAEGQLYMGALGAMILAWAAEKAGVLNSPLGAVVGITLGVLLAAGLALIAAVLKVYRGVHEVVSTIMLNWIAFWTVYYIQAEVLYWPKDPTKSIPTPPGARIPLMVSGTELSWSFIVALVVTVFTYYLLWHMVHGYELRASGLSPKAARYAGIDPNRSIILAFVLGGVAAGLAGAMVVMGTPPHYAVTSGLSNIVNLGFDGITVSLIGANHPLGMIPAAILIGALKAGSRSMQAFAGIPLEMVRIVEGIIIIALAMPGILHMIEEYLRRRRELRELAAREEAEGAQAQAS